MKKITKVMLDSIEKQMYNKGRDIDVAVFNSLVSDDMPKEYVLDCLYMFQNKDGGFGNGLHIDNYNTNSSVFQTYEALNILYMVGFSSKDEDDLFIEIKKKVFNYLYNRSNIINNKWNPVEKTNNNFAHSKMFEFTSDVMERFNYFPTIQIIAFTLHFCNENDSYYKKAYTMGLRAIDEFMELNSYNKLDLIGFGLFYEIINKMNLYQNQLQSLYDKLLEMGLLIVDSDLEKWNNKISVKPIEVFDHLNSNNPKVKDLIDKNLDYIISNLKSHGLWEHNTDWETNYPEEASASIKWMGVETYRNIYILKKYGRIE